MTWSRLDDDFWAHPKVLKAGNEATGVYARMLSYCGRMLTDGYVPAEVIPILTERPETVEKLVEVGLLEQNHDGYLIHDFLKFNPSKKQKEAERREAAKRMKRVRANKGRTG